jgi:hypothetical protein
MSEEKLFVRDPREVPFLHDQVKKIIVFADNSSRNIPIREDDDFGFMTIQFLYKQMQHTESILSLIPRRDAGLIARTMYEGLYQLLWASHAPEERARLWRSFAIIHDWRLIQSRLTKGISVDEDVIRTNEVGLREFGNLHRINNPKPYLSDPYHKSWRGTVRISDMANEVGRELYDGPYAELSDWMHWGVSGIGESISREENHSKVNSNSERIAGLSLLAAFQCLLQTLEVADAHLNLKITNTIQTLGKDFIGTINSFYQA